MAKRENLPNNEVQFTLNVTEMLALRAIIGKLSRDKSITELWQYVQAGSFAQLLDHERESGEYRIPHL